MIRMLCIRLRLLLGTIFLPRNQSRMNVRTTKNVNVALLGTAFMLVFTAFQTLGNVETTILNSAKRNGSSGYVPDFHGSGYASLATIYTSFALANWLAPPVVAAIGARCTMVVGSVFYAIFIGQFLWLNDYLLYSSSLLLGFGAAILWTAQGNFLTVNSEPETMSRNSGIFWAMFQASMLIGNAFVFAQFQGLQEISEATRNVVIGALLSICIPGIVVLAMLRPTSWMPSSETDRTEGSFAPTGPLKRAWSLMWTPQMMLLGVTFFYTGLELTFWSGVYGPSVGFTLAFGSAAKSLVGLHGILVGVGEIIGGLLFGIFGQVTNRRGRDPIVMLGLIVHLATYFLIFLNIPNTAPFGDTMEPAFINSNPYLAVFCSFLLGFGDACYNTQILSILGSLYADNSTSAFAIFKFIQSSAAALAFFYSDHCPLYYQLLVLVILCVLASIAFVRVELKSCLRADGHEEDLDHTESTSCGITSQPDNHDAVDSER